MRDAVSNVCNDLMSSVLPLLIPTANNLSKLEPCPDCYKLNPNATESFVLRKYLFFGYFLGWSLRNMGALGIDIVPSFWNRLCGGPTYVYTLEDVEAMDIYRHKELIEIKKAAEEMEAEVFDSVYGDYVFEGNFDGQGDIELFPGGKEKKLTKENVNEYLKLWLEKYT